MSLCLDGSGRHCQCQPDDARQSDESRYCDNPAVARTMKWYEETLRRDAERYRWLRDFGYMNVIPADTASLRDGRGSFAMLIHPSADGKMTLVLNNESLDSAIDAQMKKGE